MTRDFKHWVYKAVSYFWDLKVETADSGISGRLYVRMVNGKLLLDAANANYSFGSLHRLFRKVFQHIGIGANAPSNLLLLGLGGGSIVSIIRDEYLLDLPITAIEKDPEVIRIANKFFSISRFSNLDIVCIDAEEYIRTSHGRFDMIIVDLFIDNNVPEQFIRKEFLEGCLRILSPGGRMVFNFITNTVVQGERYQNLLKNLETIGFIYTEKRIFATNRVLFLSLP
jgi:spermidine synthase